MVRRIRVRRYTRRAGLFGLRRVRVRPHIRRIRTTSRRTRRR